MKNGPGSPDFVTTADGDRVAKRHSPYVGRPTGNHTLPMTPNANRKRVMNHKWVMRR